MLKPTQYVVGRAILNLAWAHVDVVVALWRFPGCCRVEFVSFVEPQVACISVNVLRIRRNKLPSARNVKLVSGAINNVGRIFMPKCQVFPFLPLAISGSRFPLLFFVELGASMKLASMIRPLQNLKPASLIRSLIVLKICSPMLCFSRKCLSSVL